MSAERVSSSITATQFEELRTALEEPRGAGQLLSLIRVRLASLLGVDVLSIDNLPVYGAVLHACNEQWESKEWHVPLSEHDHPNVVRAICSILQAHISVLSEEEKDSGPIREKDFLLGIAAYPADFDRWSVFFDWLEEKRGLEIRLSYPRQVASLVRYQKKYPGLEIPDPPSLAAVVRTFSLEQWKALEHLHEPRLVLVPPVDFTVAVMILNLRRENLVERIASVNPKYGATQHPAPLRWQAFFVEGSIEMPPRGEEDVKNELLRTRFAREEARIQEKGIQGIDRHLYAALVREALDDGRPIDPGYWTILNADRMVDRVHFPDAFYVPHERRVHFNYSDYGNRDPLARFRSAVGGDIPDIQKPQNAN